MKCKATNREDPYRQRAVRQGRQQTIENTGPLHKERMETVDEEFLSSALDFIDRKTKEGGPWFCYFNPTRMHIFTHLQPSSVGKTGLGHYPDGMVELDGYVGQLLKKLDDLKVADNTIVVFTTDNGAEVMTWPDGGATPFRGEKDTNWEGGWRVPCVMRWPGVIKPGRVINEIGSLQDFIPTFAAANGEPDLVEKVKKGYAIGDKTYKVHLDGFNLMPFLAGKEDKSPRQGFIYWSDDGDCMAMRMGRFKIVFTEQRNTGLAVWREPCLRCGFPSSSTYAPSIRARRGEFRIRPMVPGEYSHPVRGATHSHEVAGNLKEFPPRAKAASFTIDQVVGKLMPKD